MTRQATTQEHHHSVRRLSALQSPSLLENRCRPSPCARAFPGSEYYGGSALSRTDRWSVHPAPPRPLEADAKGKAQNSSRVHSDSLVGVGARLCPCGLAASTPQSFLAASLAAHAHHLGSSPPSTSGQVRAAPSPYPPDLSWCRIKGVSHAGSSRTPLRLARRTRTTWQYWPVPALSGLLPPFPAPPGSGCPQLRRPAATGSAT